MMMICMHCNRRGHHVWLRGGMTDAHRRSHKDRGRDPDVREMSEGEADLLLAQAGTVATDSEWLEEARARRRAIEREAEAERRRQRAAEQEANRAARVARRAAAEAAVPATTVVVPLPDLHAGETECGCGRWVHTDRLEAHQANPRCLRARREKAAAERRAKEAAEEAAKAEAERKASEAAARKAELDAGLAAMAVVINSPSVPEAILVAKPSRPTNPVPLGRAEKPKGFLAKLFGG